MQRSRRKKLLRISVIIAGSLLVLIFIMPVLMNTFLQPFYQKQLKDLVRAGSDSLYYCSVEKVSFNLWRARAELRGVSITLDSARYKKLEKAGSLPPYTLEVFMDYATVKGIRVFPLLLSRKLYVHDFSTDEIRVVLYENPVPAPNPVTPAPVWKRLLPVVKGIYQDEMHIGQIHLTIKDRTHRDKFLLTYERLQVHMKDIIIDSLHAEMDSSVFFAKSLDLNLLDLHVATFDSLYRFSVKKLDYTSSGQHLTIEEAKVESPADPGTYADVAGCQVDVMQLGLKRLEVYNFFLAGLVNHKSISADSVVAENLDIEIYRDRNEPRDTSDQYAKYPHIMLKNMPFSISIGLMRVRETAVTYREKQAQNDLTATLSCKEINGVVRNISNRPTEWSTNPLMIAEIEGVFLGQGRLKATAAFNLASENESYAISGELRKLDAAHLTPVTEALANLRMNTFNLHYVSYEVKGNKDGCYGMVRLLYNDLSLMLLSPQSNGEKAKDLTFISGFANAFFLRKDNPGKDDKEIISPMMYTHRTRSMSFFSLVSLSLLQSSKEIVLRGSAKNMGQ